MPDLNIGGQRKQRIGRGREFRRVVLRELNRRAGSGGGGTGRSGV